MNILFILKITILITIEVIGLFRINLLLERRNMIIDMSGKEKDELLEYGRSDLKKFIITVLEVYFYYIVMIIGLFTTLIWFSVGMILITFISSKFAKKYENNFIKFKNYSIIDKVVSILVLIGALIYL